MKSQLGFTLIELMITIVIIGVLATIAIPAYVSYLARSQHGAGFADIYPGLTTTEVLMNSGTDVASVGQIGIQAATEHCSAITANGVASTGTAEITCTLKGQFLVSGKIITFSRTLFGHWQCSSTADVEYRGNCN